METADKDFSPEESLRLIQRMINKTKEDISEDSFNFLLWGWLTFIAVLGQYTLKVIFDYNHHYLVWLISFVGIGMSIVYNRKKSHNRVRTYISESVTFLWMGLGISFFILIFLFANIQGGWLFCHPFFILLYGLGTFVSGMILKFKPLIIGGIINWALSMTSVFFDFDNQLLFTAAALLTSYIIPGHLLSGKKNHHKD